MRPELRGLTERDYWVYGVRPWDFDHTVELVRSFVHARFELFRQEAEATRAGASNPEWADEVLDDPAYYTYIDAQYAWQFCLWRLQGILEGIISRTLLRRTAATPTLGLKARLKSLRRAGYTLSKAEEAELLDWAALRNALSHAPPERYRPGPLTEEDALEYRDLARGLAERWYEEYRRLYPGDDTGE